MAEYQLYCFAQSGNSYRSALMLSVHRRGLATDLCRFFQG